MTLDELHGWILSSDGLGPEIKLLAQKFVATSLPLKALSPAVAAYQPDWPRLILSASILGAKEALRPNETALLIAHAGVNSGRDDVADASATLLSQLANQRAIQLAEKRDVLDDGLPQRVGAVERLLLARRTFESSIFLARGGEVDANRFQKQFWTDLSRAGWVSASAPTASGKTYLVLRWLLSEIIASRAQLAVVVAPTRALVSELEQQLLDLAVSHDLKELRVASLPLAALVDRSRPTILVLTQERLHVLLNACAEAPSIDVLIVDEVQKLGDGLRGVILQDAIERATRQNKNTKVAFLSPLTENPEAALRDAPRGTLSVTTPSEIPTVTQNLIVAKQLPRDSKRWQLSLFRDGEPLELGELALHAKPDTAIKRLSYISLAIGRGQVGTLIYANGAAEAEKIAWQIYDALDDAPVETVDIELRQLSEFARDTVHPKFQLVELALRGVAFHYGNMPSLLRTEIERLFRDGKLRFLVCTSTLIEGVNLACRTIVVMGPRKGRGRHMAPHDFWNLAGRAGRWGQEFVGNIICIDVHRPDLWPEGTPQKRKYPIRRETDVVLDQAQALCDYLLQRGALSTDQIKPQFEQVAAYLLAWQAREGTVLSSPSMQRLAPQLQAEIEGVLKTLLATADIPSDLIDRHAGVSAVSLGRLLGYFKARSGDLDELLPASPESDDAYERFTRIFKRVNEHLFPAFTPAGLVPLHVLVTLEWMRGLPLGQIIRRRIEFHERRRQEYKLAQVIRETMAMVEEIARFRAPKYLSAYVDILRYHMEQNGLDTTALNELKLDLFLEFGVSTTTLLALIGLGLSRTSAVAINEFLADDNLDERAVLDRLVRRDWASIDIPAVVKREIENVVVRRTAVA